MPWMAHLDALPLLGALCEQEGLVAVRALHPQEAVGGVADARGQHAVTQHGVDHRALTVAGPGGTTSQSSASGPGTANPSSASGPGTANPSSASGPDTARPNSVFLLNFLMMSYYAISM